MVVCSVVICYSRIYLGKHFPMDLVWGTLVGAALGYAALRAYRRLGELGGAVKVVHVPAQAGKVLRAAGLDKLMEFE